MARRTLLSAPGAPNLTAIVDEAVLRPPVGGPGVMREQLEELLRPRRNVTVHVVPFSIGAFAGLEGGFTLLDFPAETAFPPRSTPRASLVTCIRKARNNWPALTWPSSASARWRSRPTNQPR
jgi:hypothetical protein